MTSNQPTNQPLKKKKIKLVIKEEEEKKTICSACKRDFTDEVDDRSSFDEIGKIICKDCFEEEEEEEVDISCIESELDNMLYQENMDWSFDKPTKGKYETIYIIKREE
jgi:superfamily II helicase